MSTASVTDLQPHDETQPRPDVSIVLPTYNEIGSVREEVERIRTSMDASDYSWEIVAVDDCSSDGTRDYLRSAAAKDPRIRLIEHRRNLGSGGARRTGTRAARGHVVVWTDVDMTYPNDKIPAARRSSSRATTRSSAPAPSEEGTHKALRVPAKWLIRRLASSSPRTKSPTSTPGFRAFRRDVAVPYLNRCPSASRA